jgi:AraC-like DNA-binding protein
MRDVAAHRTKLPELAWLLDVTESRQPLSETSPIWVRHGEIHAGPPIPHPERHPYCEFGIVLAGEGVSMVENEEADRRPGDLFLAGPGVPHWGRITKYPLKFITIFFLPSVVVEMGPQSDGPRILSRFTAKQPLAERLVRPPRPLRRRLTELFREAVVEFERKRFGREVRLRSLLMEAMVQLLRWEEAEGRNIGAEGLEADWRPVSRTLQYLREHYPEPIYAKNVARAAGVSESRLKILFQNTLGMSWVKYLQGYRIHRAAALLGESGHNVTEAALEVGFESLSHFNATFRSFMGVAPSHYTQRDRPKSSGNIKNKNAGEKR